MDEALTESPEGIAIVGMAGRLPGARDAAAFWQNVKNGVETIKRLRDEELEVPEGTGEGDAGSQYVKAKGVLDDVDMFDARFFGYLPREAEVMDPQQRVFLELAWEALENAGCDPERYPGAIGVFAGCYVDTYLLANLCTNPEFLHKLVGSIQVGSLQTELGNDKDYLATRVSFKLGLRGPSFTVQTACSTSLVSIALACQSLLSHQSDMALAGGVTITFPQRKGYFYREGGMLSGDGHCRAFDANAQGTVFSNGAAVVVFKRLADALQDGDTIYAVIKGTAINNDGAQKISYTAPSVDGQAEVIALAMAMAGWDAGTMGYVEAHGTATPLGDPIEIAALTKAYRQTTEASGYCAIGSVKTNVGHLDVASGAVATIKTALALKEGVLPPSLNFERPNPKIDFARTPFYVNTELRPWPKKSWPRRAGVSSFGVGGTNAHVVMEEPPPSPPREPGRRHSLFVLSAKTETALEAQATRLADALEADPSLDLEDAAFTLQVGRKVFEHRRAVVAPDREGAIKALRARAEASAAGRSQQSDPPLVFMFPGQGAQYPNMARELYEAEPVFRQTIDECGAHLSGSPGELDLLAALYPAAADDAAAEFLMQTRVSQPAIFAVEVALARLLASWGLLPAVVLGHSVGEFAAACFAGVFPLETALSVVAARGRLMQAQPPGRMLAVRRAAREVETLLPHDLEIAAKNSPELCVVSGPTDSIDAFAALLANQKIASSILRTSHAFHSAMMDGAATALVAEIRHLHLSAPKIPIFSTALGRPLTDGEATDPGYWGRQLRLTVRFAEAIETLAAEKERAFVEVGPGQTLQQLARQTTTPLGGRTVLSCLGPLASPGSDEAHLLGALGRLWTAGTKIDFAAFAKGGRRRVPLPTYPFERKRHWVEPTSLGASQKTAAVPRPVAEPAPVAAPAMGSAPVGNGHGSRGTTEELLRQQLQVMTDQLAVFGRLR